MEKSLGKRHKYNIVKSKMPKVSLQGMTNKVRFTFSISDTTNSK